MGGDSDRGAAGEASTASRVLFVGHLPHGFFETQLKEYFSQFGKVLKVRVSRSKRTTKSKGYGYVQFQLAEVARIAADAMNGYMMFGQTLRVHLVPPDAQHAELFKNANTKMKRKPWQKIEAERLNRERTPEQHAARVRRLVSKDKKRAARIRASGIEYEYEPLEMAVPKKAKKIVYG